MPNQYKNKVVYGDSVLMDITDTTAEAGDVASGAVFYAKNGARTVGTFTQAQSDWIEDDTTDPAYILNRTHYKESIGNYGEIDLSYLYTKLTESSYTDSVISKTYSYKTTSTSCYSTQVNGFPNFLVSDFDTSATSAKININGVEYTLTQLYVPGESESAVSYFYYYNDDVLAKVGVRSTYLDHFNVSLYTNSIDDIDIPDVILYAPSSIENYHYYTLNNKYLDGVLPKRGLAYASEVFNEQPRSAAKGLYSHAEGSKTQANGNYAHAEGVDAIADGTAPHAEGWHTWANRIASHAEGQYGIAFSDGAHVEGSYSTSLTLSITLTGEANATTYTVVDYDSDKDIIKNPNLLIGYYCSAKQARIINEVRQGGVHRTITLDKTLNATEAITEQTFMFYCTNAAYGQGSHAEGTATRADGAASHAEGHNTNAIGSASHAEGRETIAKYDNQHVQGKYNSIDPSGLYADIVGNGTADEARSNAYTLDWSGNGWFAGKVTVGAAPVNNMDVATKQYVDNTIPTIPDEVMVVTFTQGNTITADKTYAQIYSVVSNGGTALGYDGYAYYPVKDCSSYGITFEKIAIINDEGAYFLNIQSYYISNSDEITYGYDEVEIPQPSSSTPLIDGTAAVGISPFYARADHVHPKITQTISMSNNVITLTGSDGSTSSVTLPVYNGSVVSGGGS